MTGNIDSESYNKGIEDGKDIKINIAIEKDEIKNEGVLIK